MLCFCFGVQKSETEKAGINSSKEDNDIVDGEWAKNYKKVLKIKREVGNDKMLKDIDVEKIIEVNQVRATGELVCLVKWRNQSKVEYVPVELAHIKCPQMLIKFYENRIYWENKDGIRKMDGGVLQKSRQ